MANVVDQLGRCDTDMDALKGTAGGTVVEKSLEYTVGKDNPLVYAGRKGAQGSAMLIDKAASNKGASKKLNTFGKKVDQVGTALGQKAPCMAVQIGAMEGAKFAMKKAAGFAMKRSMREAMEEGTLKTSEQVATKMATKTGEEAVGKYVAEEVGEKLVVEEAAASLGPVGWGIDLLLTAGMLMDMGNPEGYLEGKADKVIEHMAGAQVVPRLKRAIANGPGSAYKQLVAAAEKETDPAQKKRLQLQAACMKYQMDTKQLHANPVQLGTGTSSVQTVHDGAINLNDPVVRRKIQHYMMDYLKYTGKGTADEPPLKKDGSPDERNWILRQYNSNGDKLAAGFMDPDVKAHKKYTRTPKQLGFEDGYAKPIYQLGVKHKNKNLHVISGSMQDFPSIWASVGTLVVGLLIWVLLRFLPLPLHLVNAGSSFAIGSALLYIKFEGIDTTPILDYLVAAGLFGFGALQLR